MGEAKRRRQYDFTNILPNHILPEDVPKLIREVAEGCAGAHFEASERSPTFRARWKNPYQYVKLNWASFVPDAKETLAKMLTMSDREVPLEVKDAIMEAFLAQANNKNMNVPASAMN